MKEPIIKILKLFNKTEKNKLLILFVMMVFAAIFETIGIGLIVPFIGIITNPNIIQEQPILLFIYELFNFQSTTLFIIFSVIIFLGVFLLKNIYLLIFHYAQYTVIFNQQVQLSRRLFNEYLTKPYTFHLQKNSADLIRNVNGEVPKVFQGIILSTFHLLTELLVIICILTLLVITAPVATIVASTLLAGSVFLFFKVFRNKISYLGQEQQRVGGAMIKWVKQGLGASKEVKVSGKESFFVNSYTGQSQIQANNNKYMKMLEQVPRIFIESLLVSIVLITMLIIILQGTNTAQIVSTMALFAMAAFRLMPSINRVVGMISSIRYSYPALSVIYEDLFENKEEASFGDSNKITSVDKYTRTYNESIILDDVSFRYPNQREYSVREVSLTIPIGSSVAFIGESGAGKTTIVDLILGLYRPEKGKVTIDGKALDDQREVWQKNIGYIPQFIFLSDDSIRANVAFGVDNEKIDDKQVWRALEQAQLKEFVQDLPRQLETNVGEAGVRLSGGQRQRIGIARALYHNPEILFMDEATSALDNETEKEIMRAIDGLKGDKTLIIIAHRLSTIENCDIIFKMNKGRLIATINKSNRSIV
ncbi:ABC-type multidrug transport system fused ATPase/permease subunit [Evansella vedderi]|uniref:ABC-type multidrug transport system fused ATPase/permease subunit n=1 Tax=Evansella vedderi TaxID=38282 RepID=A0ABT9ZZB7_9BACI|nr:ABC-type multidrug transport system fused ATPase/permease subunit [Evansella vedderi]